MYFNKEAIVKVGDVVFEEETINEHTAEADFLNPTVPNENTKSAPITNDNANENSPEIANETAPMPPDTSQPPEFPNHAKIPSLDSLSSIQPNMDMGKQGAQLRNLMLMKWALQRV